MSAGRLSSRTAQTKVHAAVERLKRVLVADSLPKRHDGEAHADQIGQSDKHRPPLLQVRDDVGDVVVHVLTCP